MEDKYFVWDEVTDALDLTAPTKTEDEIKKDKRKQLLQESDANKIYCPHKRLLFEFKETLNFAEQTRYTRRYLRKAPTGPNAVDVVLLQDVKDLALYLLISPVSIDFLGFLHLPIVDRFLRALVLYMQHFITTWTELGTRRAATAKRASNPLAGGARLRRAQEMSALRWVLAREYADLLTGCQPEAKKYHHAVGGEMTSVQSKGEKDFRVFEGLIQLAHRVSWIALERKQKELIGVEMNRLFRSDAFNMAKRRYSKSGNLEVPEDEHWILYGPKMPPRRKISRNSPLPYEVLNSTCDYRVLSLGLTNDKTQDPRIMYLENALLAKEEDLPRLGIKMGILGLPRSDFDLLLIPQASEEDQMILDDAPSEKSERADDYETLMPACSSDTELTKPFSVEKIAPRYVGDDKIRKNSRKKWIKREILRNNQQAVDAYSVYSLAVI